LEAHPVSLAKNLFTIGFDPEFASQLELVNNSKTHSLLQTKLQELGHAGVQIKFIQAERPVGRATPPDVEAAPAEPAPASVPAATPAPPLATAKAAPAAKKDKPAPAAVNLDEFKKDPLIQKALEVFRGTIVEVRA
jgi:hypothetical protein